MQPKLGSVQYMKKKCKRIDHEPDQNYILLTILKNRGLATGVAWCGTLNYFKTLNVKLPQYLVKINNNKKKKPPSRGSSSLSVHKLSVKAIQIVKIQNQTLRRRTSF